MQAIRIYAEPDFKSRRLGWRRRDQLLDLVAEVVGPRGPAHNPRWYRVVGGYAHSAYLQRVETAHFNPPLAEVPEGGQLAEVTVPLSQSRRFTRSLGWQPLYRLYFGSVYWITGVNEGPDHTPWYALTDDRLHVVYHVPAAHLRPLPADEISPLSTAVPPDEKTIRLELGQQRLTAYEGNQPVYQARIASGIPSAQLGPDDIPTDTPPGRYRISVKTPSRHMGDGELTADPQAYELPGVPWVSFFHHLGIGFHGTYWHDNFGTRMSHGCVNLSNRDALWLYRWTEPAVGPGEWYQKGRGTVVDIRD